MNLNLNLSTLLKLSPHLPVENELITIDYQQCFSLYFVSLSKVLTMAIYLVAIQPCNSDPVFLSADLQMLAINSALISAVMVAADIAIKPINQIYSMNRSMVMR